jgi:hypothetical protein
MSHAANLGRLEIIQAIPEKDWINTEALQV